MTLDPNASAFTPAFKTVKLDPAAANGPSGNTHSKYLVGHIYEIFETTSSFAERLFRKSTNYDLNSPIALEGARILDEISKEGSGMGKIRPCVVLSAKWEQEFDEEPRNWGTEHWGPKIALGATFGREAFEDLSQVVKGFVVGISPNPAGSAIGRQLETSPPWLHSCQWFIAYGFHSKRRVGRLWRGRNVDPNVGYCLPPGELKRFRQLAMDLASTWYEACEKDASLAENCAVSFRVRLPLHSH